MYDCVDIFGFYKIIDWVAILDFFVGINPLTSLAILSPSSSF